MQGQGQSAEWLVKGNLRISLFIFKIKLSNIDEDSTLEVKYNIEKKSCEMLYIKCVKSILGIIQNV